MQASGFIRARNRKIGAANQKEDPLGAGLYLFAGVRWLDPDCPADATQLSANIISFNSIFASYGCSLQLESLRSNLRRVISLWKANESDVEKRRRRIRPKARCTAGDDPPEDNVQTSCLDTSTRSLESVSTSFALTPKVARPPVFVSLSNADSAGLHQSSYDISNDQCMQPLSAIPSGAWQQNMQHVYQHPLAHNASQWSRSDPEASCRQSRSSGHGHASGAAPTDLASFNPDIDLEAASLDLPHVRTMISSQAGPQAPRSRRCRESSAFSARIGSTDRPAGDGARPSEAPTWSVLDDLPTGDSSAGWATFDSLLPAILRKEGP